jgi:hypothetical protein
MVNYDSFDALGAKKLPERGLGFATPVLERDRDGGDLIPESMRRSEKSGGRHGNILTQIAESEASPEREQAKTVVCQTEIRPFMSSQS